jgi:hypothetical protein
LRVTSAIFSIADRSSRGHDKGAGQPGSGGTLQTRGGRQDEGWLTSQRSIWMW